MPSADRVAGAAVFATASLVMTMALRAQTPPADVPAPVLTCIPDRPVAHPGDSVSIRALPTYAPGKDEALPGGLKWTVTSGTIEEAEPGSLRWSFPHDALVRKAAPVGGAAGREEKLEAHALATAGGQVPARVFCDVVVYVVPVAQRPSGEPVRGLLAGRALLLPSVAEPSSDPGLAGYGLYSYLLFDAPPSSDLESQRFLKALESYLLLLPQIEELEHHRPRSQLNVTLLPVTRPVPLPEDITADGVAARTAAGLLSAYDYARARHLRDLLGSEVPGHGLYLVAVRPPRAAAERAFLSVNLSRASPELVWSWVRSFCWLTAQERGWSEIALSRLALNLRNVIAIAARRTPEMASVTVGKLSPW
jgi:hypothetical protein